MRLFQIVVTLIPSSKYFFQASLRLDEKPFNINESWDDNFHSEHGAPTIGKRKTKHRTLILIILTITCLVFLAAAGTVLFFLTKPDHKTSSMECIYKTKRNIVVWSLSKSFCVLYKKNHKSIWENQISP